LRASSNWVCKSFRSALNCASDDCASCSRRATSPISRWALGLPFVAGGLERLELRLQSLELLLELGVRLGQLDPLPGQVGSSRLPLLLELRLAGDRLIPILE